ncbi:MAG: glycerophosphodiester phosphodiesterase, partial [Planctomycetales bacterium]|nr:glycerophosphodiester phosphodiesterase [Planctomycetales bacterium]
GRKLSVANSTLAELRQLEYGSWKAPAFQGEPIPTFAQVAAAIPSGKTFVIELKTGPEIVPLLAKQIADSQLDPRQLLIIAFDSGTVAKAKQLLPNIRAHWLTAYRQDKKTSRWTPTAEEICETLQACSADGLGTQGNRAVLDAAFLRSLQAGGLREFHVWTVDSPADALYFQQLGAMGITTNRPAYIRQALAH